jgi:hypothetical protein
MNWLTIFIKLLWLTIWLRSIRIINMMDLMNFCGIALAETYSDDATANATEYNASDNCSYRTATTFNKTLYWYRL